MNIIPTNDDDKNRPVKKKEQRAILNALRGKQVFVNLPGYGPRYPYQIERFLSQPPGTACRVDLKGVGWPGLARADLADLEVYPEPFVLIEALKQPTGMLADEMAAGAPMPVDDVPDDNNTDGSSLSRGVIIDVVTSVRGTDIRYLLENPPALSERAYQMHQPTTKPLPSLGNAMSELPHACKQVVEANMQPRQLDYLVVDCEEADFDEADFEWEVEENLQMKTHPPTISMQEEEDTQNNSAWSQLANRAKLKPPVAVTPEAQMLREVKLPDTQPLDFGTPPQQVLHGVASPDTKPMPRDPLATPSTPITTPSTPMTQMLGEVASPDTKPFSEKPK